MHKASSNPNIPNWLYHLDYRVYSRPFRIPLHTYHGEWTERQGILIKLSTEQGYSSFGEIAPLPWFGSETLEGALNLCHGLGTVVRHIDLLSISDQYPASQFGMESAVESLQTAIANYEKVSNQALSIPIQGPMPGSIPTPPHCHLLPTGVAALTSWQHPWSKGLHDFKWKIGVNSIQEELTLFARLVQSLPPAATIRLDANGGLSWKTACQWLALCDQLNNQSSQSLQSSQSFQPSQPDFGVSVTPTIEFLEQPLSPDRFADLLALSQRYQTPLALDESVATFAQLKNCYDNGWRSIFVIKAAIAGSPSRLRRFCQQNDLDIVWSSALETAIARQFITHHLIPTLPTSSRSLGFGVDQWFKPSALDHPTAEAIWNSCAEP